MKFSLFEQAAAEATLGMRDIDAQLDCVMAEIKQLKLKRDLLETLSRQLVTLRSLSADQTSPKGAEEQALSGKVPPAEPLLSGNAAPEADRASAAGAEGHSVSFSLREEVREEWLSRRK